MKSLDKFTDLMVKKIESLSTDWQKPWFTTRSNGLPQNLTGRSYNGMNSLMLFMLCEDKNYTTPVFATFNQLKDEGCKVLKGEAASYVAYWNLSIKDSEGKPLTINDYNKLSTEEKSKYTVTPFLKEYPVFNIEQSNLPEIKPELWEEIKEKFAAQDLRDELNMYRNEHLDKMIHEQSWVCPIHVEEGDRAYHTRGIDDYIAVPLKGQFNSGEAFYSTLLHEMAHSTGEEHRLNRDKNGSFGDPKYAKEELIAEMTSAVTGQSLGISSSIREENAQYLKSWLSAIKEEPKFLKSILTDVGKAANMINENVLSGKEIDLSLNNTGLTDDKYTLNKEEAEKAKKLSQEGYRDDQILSELTNFFGKEFGSDVLTQITEISKKVNEELNIPFNNTNSLNSLDEAKQWVDKNPEYRHFEEKKEKQEQKTESKKVEYAKIDWNEIKSKVSILQVANDLGYKLVDGKTTAIRPVLRDANGDTIIIKNPVNYSSSQYYNPNDFRDKGSVIDFVKNRIDRFSQHTGRNETDKLNNVLKYYSGVAFNIDSLSEKMKISNPKVFDINAYPSRPAELNNLGYLSKERNISNETLQNFLPHIHMVKNKNYENIGFPYSIPGEDKIRGYELRNYGFKSFSEGGDKVNAVWLANFAPDKSMVRNIYVTESAIDAMSFFELNKGKIDLNTAVFVSTGGTLLYSQINNLKNEYPNAKFNGCFDKDLAGNLYDITLACAVEGKTANKVIKGEKIEFRVDGKTFEMKKDDVNLNNFLKEAGFTSGKTESHKPSNGKDFNEVLAKKNDRNPVQKPYNFKR